MHHVAARAEAALGDERPTVIDSSPRDWQALPPPEGEIVVGIDGGYVRDWTDKKDHFGVLVGKSLPRDRQDATSVWCKASTPSPSAGFGIYCAPKACR